MSKEQYFVFTAEVPIDKVKRFKNFCHENEIFLICRNEYKLVDIKGGK